ncbi:MAG TPA: hypothetical protein EYG97_05130 [Arcobacter sp.]|nr:hypothetical protein [Arcobacter sp.]HIP56391.1 hypothetical protein [Arcobacter sp.]
MDIDSILEDDLMDALENLGDLNNIEVSKEVIEPIINEEKIEESITEETPIVETTSLSSSISVESTNIDSIALLIKELLNNKTIEISIKIK